MTEAIIVFSVAFVLDLILGDPEYPLHPARLIGKAVSTIEKLLRLSRLSGMLGGILLLMSVSGLSIVAYCGIRYFAESVHHWGVIIFDVFVVYSCIALRDLLNHVKPIVAALDENDLQTAQNAVQKIVGRDTTVLDANAVSRAAIESLSESFIDGFLPLSAGMSSGQAVP